MNNDMALYYLPVLIRSDRYYISRLESGAGRVPDFNFVVSASDRVLTPLLTLEDPGMISINQLAPSLKQDIPLLECTVSLIKEGNDFILLLEKTGHFEVRPYYDEVTGIRLDYSPAQKRLSLGIYQYQSRQAELRLRIVLDAGGKEHFSSLLLFQIVRPPDCNRVVIDFGSEASQIGYRNNSPQSVIEQYDILENIVGRLRTHERIEGLQRAGFLNHEPGQNMLYRSFYAVKKNIGITEREGFPFNFSDRLSDDEIRLFISRAEVAATEYLFRDQYEIIPNLKLGIEKSIQLTVGNSIEDYSIRDHKQELISAILLRLLRLMISSKPGFRKGGLIVTLLVPNIYTQHDIFDLLSQLRKHSEEMTASLGISAGVLNIEFETISESDAAFMGYQQTHPEYVNLSNGDMALVIDSGKGTTDISMLLADDNENYSSFFRTGFAGAGNVMLYGFIEDYLTLVLRAIPGNNDHSVREFVSRYIQNQHLTTDVLDFIQLMEDQKKGYRKKQALGITEFAGLSENSPSTERTISNLHKDPATLLTYSTEILRQRNLRWDEEVTGLISKAVDCIVQGVISGIREVMTKDIRKRTRLVLLSGRAFYFDLLKERLEEALKNILQEQVSIRMLPAGRSLNNKNIAIYGAFSGAYKITDFAGMPVDRKKGLSANNDVLNNNLFLYRGLKIEPANDILYNNSVVRRNNQELKAFKNKTIDLCFTRDNIYLRLMENQRVRDVKSLYTVLAPMPENYARSQDMKAISMFPNYTGELASLALMHTGHGADKKDRPVSIRKKRKGVFPFFNF